MIARIKATGELIEIIAFVTETHNTRGHYIKTNQIELIPDEPETITDGHGNTWSKKCKCGNDMQVVRPGSAICVKCNDVILANDGMPVGHPLNQ